MLSEFISAVHPHGLPEHIRTDLRGKMLVYGGTWQNNMVHQLLLLQVPQPVMNALSVCGVTYVYRCVASLFYNTFYSLEDDDKLDPNNEIDLYCLHYVYLPRVNSALQSFTKSWNDHPLSTEGNFTPNQLFVRGALHNNVIPQLPHSQGASSTGALVLPSTFSQVEVSRSSFIPCDWLLTEVTSNVDPLAETDYFGTSVYMPAIAFTNET